MMSMGALHTDYINAKWNASFGFEVHTVFMPPTLSI